MADIRAAEAINLLYFAFFTAAAWGLPLEPRRRWQATLLGALGLALTLLAVFSERLALGAAARLVRDALPAPLMLVAYWQSGRFFRGVDRAFQGLLERTDRRWRAEAKRSAPWLGAYLEFAYLSCYALVPAALAALYAAGLQQHAAEFWLVVTPASCFCYAMVPVFSALPPHAREDTASLPPAAGLRRLNAFILARGSTGANSFPSAHVAAALGASLVVLRHLPLAGGVLLFLSLSIAAGAVLRRYHYALDVLAGALVALLAFFLAGLFPPA
jgi:membrane-associated phospholipid phosphatase